MSQSFHGRPLPEHLTAFSSEPGRLRLREALAAGTAEAFYPLISTLHTQADPAWCGPATLVTTLNALALDPGRVWKGVWRTFVEEMLTCCKDLEAVQREGMSTEELACLARCHGATARYVAASSTMETAFRADLLDTVRSGAGPFLIAHYGRQALGQTGDGHFSPVAAWHAPTDSALVLDVARFKYPPHWVPVPLLCRAMDTLDPATGARRGWVVIGRAELGDATVDPSCALHAAVPSQG